jgi:DNA-binding transcriptional MocR family regulator
MPDENKKLLVELLTRKNIPLIEDDIYGELYFGKTRPKTCKFFDTHDMVLQCGSFSKSLAPGYRIGWAVPGKYKNKVVALKRMNNISTNTLLQEALSIFLQKGRYELHLRHLRKALHTQCLRYSQAIAEYFPESTRVTRPQGGFSLWIEMDEKIDAFKLHKQALKHNIGIAPGHIFSTQGQFQNYFRISYGLPYTERIDEGIRIVGGLITNYKT